MTQKTSITPYWRYCGIGMIALISAFPAQSTQVSARIKAVTCAMDLALTGAGTDLKWNVGLTTRPDGTSSIIGNAASQKRGMTLRFTDPSFNQVDPISGESYDCTKATGGISFVFKAKDATLTGDARAGAIPDVNTQSRYFEYFITYKPLDMINATGGGGVSLDKPPTAGMYQGEDVMPLTGNPPNDELKINFTSGGEKTLGSYPFTVWLVIDYPNASTAPNIASPINQYTSSVTLTATYL